MEPGNVNPRRPITVCFDAEIIRADPLDRNARLDLSAVDGSFDRDAATRRAKKTRAGQSVDSILNRFVRVNDAPTFSGA
jgi:hypothetical protein